MERWLILCGSVGGRGVWGRMDTRIRMAESLCCSCAISHIVNRLCAVLSLVAQSCLTLWEPMDCSLPASSVHGASPGKNTVVGCHALLQGIFPTQGLNPGLPHHRQILYHLSHQGSPRILEWVAYPFSRGFSQPRSQTEVSCIAGGFFISWPTREAHSSAISQYKTKS